MFSKENESSLPLKSFSRKFHWPILDPLVGGPIDKRASYYSHTQVLLCSNLVALLVGVSCPAPQDEPQRKSEAADKKLRDFATELVSTIKQAL